MKIKKLEYYSSSECGKTWIWERHPNIEDITDKINEIIDKLNERDDAEPVVRCKDCKHYTLHCSWNGEKRYWCELDILHDGENGFCSHGAKMDEVNDE